MENKNTNKGLLVVIIALLLVVIGLGCVIGYLLINNNENKSEEKIITVEEAKKLIDDYYFDYYSFDLFEAVDNERMTNEDIKNYILNNKILQKNYKNTDCINYKSKLHYDSNYQVYIKDNEEYPLACSESTISYDLLNKLYKELFGNSSKFAKKDFTVLLEKYVYIDNEFEKFYSYGTGFGGEESRRFYDVIDTKLVDDELEIIVGHVSYISDIDDLQTCKSSINGMPIYECSELDNLNVADNIIKNNINIVNKYKMTFFKENNIYKLKNIEKQ